MLRSSSDLHDYAIAATHGETGLYAHYGRLGYWAGEPQRAPLP